MFRLPEHEAIINRLGFNNAGVDALVRNVERSSYRGVLGINIGKNKDTPNERPSTTTCSAWSGYTRHASYITINISSPNTAGLRDLQQEDTLRRFIETAARGAGTARARSSGAAQADAAEDRAGPDRGGAGRGGRGATRARRRRR